MTKLKEEKTINFQKHFFFHIPFNPLSANPTKWLKTDELFLSVFEHFVGLTRKGLKLLIKCETKNSFLIMPQRRSSLLKIYEGL